MSTDCDHEAILAGLRRRSAASREQAIEAAQHDEHADSLLAQMLDESADGTWEKIFIAAALGQVSGEDGDAALRRALNASGPGTSDLRCSALYGLARRWGESAHEDFVHGLHAKDAPTRAYALSALAACGRDGVWDEVAARLASTMKRSDRRGSVPSDTLVMIVYLLRQAASDPDRIPTLVRLLRRHWDGLDPRRDFDREASRWVAAQWPDAAPGGPEPNEVEAPDAEAIKAWLGIGAAQSAFPNWVVRSRTCPHHRAQFALCDVEASPASQRDGERHASHRPPRCTHISVRQSVMPMSGHRPRLSRIGSNGRRKAICFPESRTSPDARHPVAS